MALNARIKYGTVQGGGSLDETVGAGEINDLAVFCASITALTSDGLKPATCSTAIFGGMATFFPPQTTSRKALIEATDIEPVGEG